MDVPTFSLATVGEDGTTNMNIVTYASPVSIQPERLWSIGLVKSSLSHSNFSLQRDGILQLLRPQHASLVKLLGGLSGRDVDKQSDCRNLGFKWQSLDENDCTLPLILPDCAHYLKIQCVEVVDGGSHDVFICKVDGMWDTEGSKDDDDSYLSTRRLRQLGIITEQGRVSRENDDL